MELKALKFKSKKDKKKYNKPLIWAKKTKKKYLNYLSIYSRSSKKLMSIMRIYLSLWHTIW
jgi:hypothetical protein